MMTKCVPYLAMRIFYWRRTTRLLVQHSRCSLSLYFRILKFFDFAKIIMHTLTFSSLTVFAVAAAAAAAARPLT